LTIIINTLKKELKPFNLFLMIVKKKIDRLTEERESLQIELTDMKNTIDKAKDRMEEAKKRYLRLNEDYSNSQKELEKERELRKHSQGEAEDALRDMKNAKEKMGEERRAKEQLQVEVSQLQKEKKIGMNKKIMNFMN